MLFRSKEFKSLFVKIHLKKTNVDLESKEDAENPEGHMPASSYIANNVLTLYTTASLEMPSFLIPPPMIRFIEVIRNSGDWGVRLVTWTNKIRCIKSLRNGFREMNGTTIDLKKSKDLVESAPVLLIEGLDKTAAQKFIRDIVADDNEIICNLVYNGADQV